MKPRFVLDGMLGSLARWLRICGYDTEYKKTADDDELIKESIEHQRILLTRDKLLTKKAQKEGADSLYIKGDSIIEKLQFLAAEYDLDLSPLESRCPKCNGKLEKIQKYDVKDQVPKRSFEAFKVFWKCKDCESIFWCGTHWKNIKRTLEKASRRDNL